MVEVSVENVEMVWKRKAKIDCCDPEEKIAEGKVIEIVGIFYFFILIFEKLVEKY